MKIGNNSFVPFVQNSEINNKNEVKYDTNKRNNSFNSTKLISYPANYYLPVAFGKKLSNEELVNRIGIENFPSAKIAEMFISQPDKSLYEVHKEYYSDLLTCQTLDEAKEKYPEFESVIDSKNVDTAKLDKTSCLYKISQGKYEGLSLDNLSLDLLKKYYGEAIGTKNVQEYRDIARPTTHKLFEQLGIKRLDSEYSHILGKSNPDVMEKTRQAKKNFYRSPEGQRKNAERIQNIINLYQSEKGKKIIAERVQSRSEFDKTEAGKKSRAGAGAKTKAFYLTTEGKKMNAERKRKLDEWSKTDEGKILPLSSKLSWYFNPEIRNMKSKLATDEYPDLGILISKLKNGIISDEKTNVIRKYHKDCEEAMPEHQKEITGPVQSLIYKEIKEKIQKLKEDKADKDDLTVLSSYYILTKAQAPEYLDCFSTVEDKLLGNKDTYNAAVNMMSDFYKHIQEKYPEEIVNKYFGGLKNELQ